MRFNLFSRIPHHQNHITVLFAVGGGSVASAIVATGEGESPSQVLFAARKTLSFAKRESSQLGTELTRALGESATTVANVLAETLPHTNGVLEGVEIIVHAPWSRSVTHDAEATFEKPTRVTRELLERVARSAGDKEESEKKPDVHGEVFEQSVMRVELSGYSTAQPLGKETTSIRVVSLLSRADAAFLRASKDVVTAAFPGRSITVRSAMYAYNTVIREVVSHPSAYTFLDIGSESSTCSVVREGAIHEQGIIETGSRVLVSAAAAAAGKSESSMHSLIRMVAEGTCTDEVCEQVSRALSEAEPAFMRSFGETFSKLISEHRLPNTLIIAVHPKLIPWAKAFFGRIDFSQFTQTGTPFRTYALTPKTLAELAVFGPEAKPDTGIAVLAAMCRIRYP